MFLTLTPAGLIPNFRSITAEMVDKWLQVTLSSSEVKLRSNFKISQNLLNMFLALIPAGLTPNLNSIGAKMTVKLP